MIAAIYARSAAEDAKSITQQVEHARTYAISKGWAVDPESVYADNGANGTEFVRPGFADLMIAITTRPCPFKALILSDESRLGRDPGQTADTLRKIADAGMRVFCSDGREWTAWPMRRSR